MEPGYKKIRIQPTLTKGMTEVSATYESIYGTIVSAWSCREGKNLRGRADSGEYNGSYPASGERSGIYGWFRQISFTSTRRIPI